MANKKTEKVNHFSTLVDSLLFLIVSSLPFKEAAKTSVLSKQWRDIWRSTKNIEFEETFFVDPDETKETIAERRRVFINFAKEWILGYQDAFIQNFVLTFSCPSQFLPQILDLIKFAISHNTKSLTLNFSDQDWNDHFADEDESTFTLPQEFYNYKGLELLSLINCTLDVSIVNFQVLKDLSLGWVELKDNAINTLLKSTPLLESLILIHCFDMYELDITSSNSRLKTLIVEKCGFLEGPMVSIDGPKLHFFRYSGRIADFHLGDQSGLEEVELEFGLEVEFKRNGDILADLLEQLSSAKILNVDTYVLQVLPYGEEPPYIPEDLEAKHLVLNVAMHSNEFPGIKFLLQSCPVLETLTIDICPDVYLPEELAYYVDPTECLSKNSIIYDCFDTKLKTVQVMGFRGTEDELRLVQYLLELARSLEQMNIYLFLDEQGEVYRQKAVDNVQNFSKIASKNLLIRIF